MVEQQLLKMGIRLNRPPADDIRRPRGAPPPARKGWEDFLVAVKPVGESWPPAATARITAARYAYDAGTHEMVSTTTTSGWTMLYCIPRKTPTAPRGYFTLRTH